MADDSEQSGLGDYIRRLFKIESNNDPYNITGSNRGLGQFGPEEERKYGITPQNRTDAAVQAAAVAREFSEHRGSLTRALGREPTFGEMYLGHQQGIAGGPALLDPKNANLPAWQAIRPFYNSDAMAQRAIRGNLPSDSPLARLGINDISAPGFSSYWKDKFEHGMTAGGGALPSVPSSTALHPAAAAFNRPSNGDPFASSTPVTPSGGMISTPWGQLPAPAPGGGVLASALPGAAPGAMAASPGSGFFNRVSSAADIYSKIAGLGAGTPAGAKKSPFPFPDFKLQPLDTAPLHPLALRLAQLQSVLPQNVPFSGHSGTGGA